MIDLSRFEDQVYLKVGASVTLYDPIKFGNKQVAAKVVWYEPGNEFMKVRLGNGAKCYVNLEYVILEHRKLPDLILERIL